VGQASLPVDDARAFCARAAEYMAGGNRVTVGISASATKMCDGDASKNLARHRLLRAGMACVDVGAGAADADLRPRLVLAI
jgi:hypothetical protein